MQTIPISVKNDDIFELTEQITVRLSNPSNGQFAGAVSTLDGVLRIFDNDPFPIITVNDIEIKPEGDSNGTVTNPTVGKITNATFTITRAGKTAVPTVLDITTANGTANGGNGFASGVDYQTINTQRTIAPNTTTQTITIDVPVFGDLLQEPDETFFLNVLNADSYAFNGTSDLTGQATIRDDDIGAPSIDNGGSAIDPIVGFPTYSGITGTDVTITGKNFDNTTSVDFTGPNGSLIGRATLTL